MQISDSEIQQAIAPHAQLPGAMLPVLHAIQDRFGYIPANAIALVASELRVSKAEVEGIISFYHHYRRTPAGAHVVQVCRAEACQARGARELEAHLKASLGIGYHETTSDNEITLEPVYCLGNCACGPNLLVDDQVKARMNPDKADQLIESLRTQALEIQ